MHPDRDLVPVLRRGLATGQGQESGPDREPELCRDLVPAVVLCQDRLDLASGYLLVAWDALLIFIVL